MSLSRLTLGDELAARRAGDFANSDFLGPLQRTGESEIDEVDPRDGHDDHSEQTGGDDGFVVAVWSGLQCAARVQVDVAHRLEEKINARAVLGDLLEIVGLQLVDLFRDLRRIGAGTQEQVDVVAIVAPIPGRDLLGRAVGGGVFGVGAI